MNLKDFGVLIREARRQQGVSQADLAAKLRMSRATISGIERGTVVEIGIVKFMALCASLDLDLSLAPRRGRPTYRELRAELQEKLRDGVKR